jgi:hypothetical protein
MNSNTQTTVQSGFNPLQLIKLVVYSLLLINWAFYIADDWRIAQHTLREGDDFLTLTAAFATSIDELAWFVLLFLFELETYLLADESFTRMRVALMHGTRIICYLFLAHTLYTFAITGSDLTNAPVAEGADNLCELVELDLSYVYNMEYTDIDSENCSTLSSASRFYYTEPELVVADKAGLTIERELAWIDLAEAAVWLVILFLIELMVRLQEKGITRGPLRQFAKFGKTTLYCLLWVAAGYWIYRGHWVFAWDEALWILGFMAIDMNLSEWKKEIEGEQASPT